MTTEHQNKIEGVARCVAAHYGATDGTWEDSCAHAERMAQETHSAAQIDAGIDLATARQQKRESTFLVWGAGPSFVPLVRSAETAYNSTDNSPEMNSAIDEHGPKALLHAETLGLQAGDAWLVWVSTVDAGGLADALDGDRAVCGFVEVGAQ